MASRKYEVAVKALMRMRPELAVVSPSAVDAVEWVQEFSSALDVVFETGSRAGVDVAADTQVGTFLQDVRGQLLQHATSEWIEHSPRVVAGREDQLRQLAAARALPAPARLSPLPLDDYSQLAEYAKRVNEGTMTSTEFEEHRLRVLTAGRGVPSVASPSLSVVPPPSSLAPTPSPSAGPSPVVLGTSVTSPLIFSGPAPSFVPGSSATAIVPAVEAAATSALSSSQRPVRQAALAASAVLAVPESPPRRSAKRARPETLMDISLIPGYVRCDYCTRNKVKCAPRLGAEPPYVCSRCEDASRPCLPPAAPVRARRRAAPARRGGPSTAEPPALFRLDYGVPSGTDRAAASVFWRNEFVRAGASLEVAQAHFTFVQARYAEVLGEAVVPVSPSLEPPSKRLKVENGEEPDRAVAVDGAEAIEVDSAEVVAVDGAEVVEVEGAEVIAVDGTEVVEVGGPAASGDLGSEMVDA
ncbi:hypothetical protein EDB84DRAFT_1437470 [Lactarius hengduanensis]|nr:hypothetical protein EDB84DRAFT_1437470 [Lactarius hengduanensis]